MYINFSQQKNMCRKNRGSREEQRRKAEMTKGADMDAAGSDEGRPKPFDGDAALS